MVPRQCCHGIWKESGQSIALIALMMPVLIGFLGLAGDFGRLAAQQRKLQNQADAAALAGAADLSKYYSNACSDANTSLTSNNNSATVSCSVGTSAAAAAATPAYSNDQITVRLTQQIPLLFFPVLGVSTKTLTATAVAAAASITGCQDNSVSNTVCSPYAAWRPGPACSGNYTDPEAGELVIIRSSQSSGWVNGTAGSVGTGAGSCSSDWTVAANDFKGFLRPYGQSYIDVGSNIISKGGNACGQEPVSDIQAAFTSGQTLIIPVLDSGVAGHGSGNPSVHIPGFITVRLDFTYPYQGAIQSVTMNGSPTGGTFTLTFNGSTTAPIPYNASASAVQSALASLASVGGNTNNDGTSNVKVLLNPDSSYTMYFQNALANQTLQVMTSNSTLLTGGSSPVATVSTTYTDSAKAGGPSVVGDYACPKTWFARIVDSSTSIGGSQNITQQGQCLSTGYVCRVTLTQ
jgi:Flp pilus assembly protein TadG